MISNPDYVHKLIQIVSDSPFPKHMAMKLVTIDFDSAELEILLNHHHLQPFGLVHGGVMATLIDTTTFWAAYLRIPEDAGLVNIDLKLNYLKTVTEGTLYGKGRCIHAGRSISYAEATIVNEGQALVAHGTSTLKILPGRGLQIGIQKHLV